MKSTINNILPLWAMGVVLMLATSCTKEEVPAPTATQLPVLTTASVSTIAQTAATSGGNISTEGGAAVTARGVCYSTSATPTVADSKTTDGAGTGVYASSITGLTANTTYYIRAYAINSIGTAYGAEVSFKTLAVTGGGSDITYGSMTDGDGNTYKTVTIGTQTWMAENLKTTKYNDGTAIPLVTDNTAWKNLTSGGYCWYNNDATTNQSMYGGLYNWFAIKTGKIAPTGWHIPTEVEWTTMQNYLMTNSYNYDGTTSGNNYSKSMASITAWAVSNLTGVPGNIDYPLYRNKSGFTALPGGYRLAGNGSFSEISYFGGWWSSVDCGTTAGVVNLAWGVTLTYNTPKAGTITTFNKISGLSVRCVKD